MATITVAGFTAAAIDSALTQAASGDTVYFPAGSYAHGSLTWPAGRHLRGAGIGHTILNFTMQFSGSSNIGDGSESGGATIGVAGSSEFYFANGAANVTFNHIRFRGRAPMWDLCDYTDLWSDPVYVRYGNFHDIYWNYCEFEWPGTTTDRYFNVWFDCRAGGGNIYNLSFDHCTFGTKRANNTFGDMQCGWLIQPSPPEHAVDGPRDNNTNWKNFNWAQVDHGSGQAAIGGSSGFGFRLLNTTFIGGGTGLNDMDICDYIRAWCYWDLKVTDATLTQAEKDRAPDKTTTKGWTLSGCWFADHARKEYGRNWVDDSLTDQGTTVYHATQEVLNHDYELYGIGSPVYGTGSTGSGKATLHVVSCSGAATTRMKATGKDTLGTISCSGAGHILGVDAAQGIDTLPSFKAQGVAKTTMKAGGAATMGAVSATGSGAVSPLDLGSGKATLGTISVSASGSVTHSATSRVTLGAFSMLGAGTISPLVRGSGSATLGAMSTAGAGKTTMKASGVTFIAPFRASVSGEIAGIENGLGSTTLGLVSVSGQGTVSATEKRGFGTVRLHTFACKGTAKAIPKVIRPHRHVTHAKHKHSGTASGDVPQKTKRKRSDGTARRRPT